MKKVFVITMVIVLCGLSVVAEAASKRGNPSEHGILLGSKIVDNMRIKLEMEPSKGMFMLMPNGMWMWMGTMGKPYHLEVKLEDPYSGTRIPYSDVSLIMINVTTGAGVGNDSLHPMWGGSGLHYAINGYAMDGSSLEDGEYLAIVTAAPPTFMRGESNKHLWLHPISADFRFRIRNGIILSNSVVTETYVDPMPEGHDKDFYHDLGTITSSSNMDIRVEFEDASTMWMLNAAGMLMKMDTPEGSIHVEVKLTDNEESGTRIPYAKVDVTLDNGDGPVTYSLHPMWGGSGLHYGKNIGVPSGTYDVTVDVGVPTYARGNHGVAPPPPPTWPADGGPYTSPTSVEFEDVTLP